MVTIRLNKKNILHYIEKTIIQFIKSLKHNTRLIALVLVPIFTYLGCTDVVSSNDKNPVITFNPNPIRLSGYSQKEIKLVLLNTDNLYSIYTEITYDLLKIRVNSVSVKNIPNHIFAKHSDQYSDNLIISDLSIDDSTSSAIGIIKIGLLYKAENFTGVSGDGVLAKIQIESLTNDPSSYLEIINTESYVWPFSDPLESSNDYEVDNGRILLQ